MYFYRKNPIFKLGCLLSCQPHVFEKISFITQSNQVLTGVINRQKTRYMLRENVFKRETNVLRKHFFSAKNTFWKCVGADHCSIANVFFTISNLFYDCKWKPFNESTDRSSARENNRLKTKTFVPE